MAVVQRADFIPTDRKLVVKHTFLEYEDGWQSPDPFAEMQDPRMRSSSDSCILYDAFALPEPAKMLQPGEDITLTGLSDDEASAREHEVESLSTSACDEGASEPETSEAAEATHAKSSGLDHLASENARLHQENLLLRQQCLEVAMAAQTAATATTNAAMSYAEGNGGAEKEAMTSPLPSFIAQQGRSTPEPSDSDLPGTLPSGMPQMMTMLMGPGQAGAPFFTPGMPFADMNQCIWVPVTHAGAMPVAPANYQKTPMTRMQQPQVAKSAQHAACGYGQTGVPQRPENRRQRASQASYGYQRCADRADMSDANCTQDSSTDCFVPENQRTTVMLRNLPNNYSRTMLLDLINEEGFAGLYDFIYLPIDFKTKASLGYAFVNLANYEVANSFRLRFDGFSDWILPSRKTCGVSWSGPHQGLEAHIERYRNSPVMHEAVPDMYKPAIFQDGVRVAFPPPSRKLRAPRVRQFHGPETGFNNNQNFGA